MRKRFSSILRTVLYLFLYMAVLSFYNLLPNARASYQFDLTVFLVIFFLMLFVYSQFIIPVKSIHERVQIFTHILLHLFGMHGVPQRIDNGTIFPKNPDPNRKGPTIVLVDTASVGIVQDGSNEIYPIGPGIHFTRSKSHIIDTAVLFPQQQTIGPFPGEDPFAPFDPQIEENSAYDERQSRRLTTTARTRDGIEIAPTFSVKFGFDPGSTPQRNQSFGFGLNRAAGPGPTEFGYNPLSISNALINHRTEKSYSQSNEWRWIPGRLTIDLWREYISRFTFTQLFPDLPCTEGMISTILGYIRARLQSPNFLTLDPEGKLNPSSTPIPSREYALLNSYGLKVDWVRIDQLCFPPDIEQKLTEKWLKEWKNQVEQTIRSSEIGPDTNSGQVESDTLLFFVNGVTHKLGAIPPDTALSPAQILHYLVRDTLDLYAREPALHTAGQDEIHELQAMQKWINERQ